MNARTAAPAPHLVVMAKAPLPGIAKTRLQRETGLAPDVVAGLARAFLLDTLRTAAGLAGVRSTVCYTPRAAEPLFRELAGAADLRAQVEGDLGARMLAGFEAAFARGAARVVMIGADSPQIGGGALRGAFDALEHADCAIVPAEDGGYCLLGLARPCPRLFAGVAWSTPRALADTLANARTASLSCTLLEPEFDVDGAADLARLGRILAADPARCPETARVLSSLPGRDADQ